MRTIMENFIMNESISLEIQGDEEQMNDFVFVNSLEDATRPKQLFRSKSSQWLNVFLSWIFVMIIGTYFRFILYEHLYEQYKKKDFTPINALILTTTLLNHLGLIVITVSRTLIVFNDTALANIPGLSYYCTFRQYFVQFTIFYGFIGGFGIAIYRILLIKHTDLVKNRIGLKIFGIFISFGGMLASVLLVVLINSHHYGKLTWELCLMNRNVLVFEMLNEYEQSRGNNDVLSSFKYVRLYAGVTCLISVVSETIIYIIFFHYIYKNDNSVSLKKLLDKKVINARNRTNAITFFGQFCSFFVELSIIFIYAAGQMRNGNENSIIYEMALNSYQIGFAVMSMVEILTSNTLRVRLIHKLDKIPFNLFNMIFNLYGR